MERGGQDWWDSRSTTWTAGEDQPNRDFSAPPAWLGMEHLKIHVANLHSWERRTDYREEARAGRVLETLPIEFQGKVRRSQAGS
eukprot:2573954-Pyramimonas_sp.AAC.1